jgi:hypothetical protein
MNLETHYQQAPECLLEDMDGEVLLYNPVNSTTLHLNAPSVVVWQLCTGENSVAGIIEALQEAYPEQAEQIHTDVVSVINELQEKQAIRPVGS